MKTHFLPILFLWLLSSCNLLDSPEPTGQLPLDDAIQTADDLETGLIGAYDLVQNGHLYGRNLLLFPDLMAGNVDWFGGGWFGLDRINSHQMQTTDWYAENTWVTAYKAINQLNFVLAAIPDVKSNDPALLDAMAEQFEGEAKLLRGVLYFDLVRLYALPYHGDFLDSAGVPLMTEPVLVADDLAYPVRASVAEVYDQIWEDFSAAKKLLPAELVRGRVNSFVATAMLARVAFQKRDYAMVLDLTNELLNGPYELTATPQDFFINEDNHEEIWPLLNSKNDRIGGSLVTVYHANGGNQTIIAPDLWEIGFGKIITPNQLSKLQADQLEPVDLRTDTSLLAQHLLVTKDGRRTNKYEDSEDDPDDLPLARIAEFLLMRAEALVWQNNGPSSESIGLLNQVRQRSLRVVDAAGAEVDGAQSEYLLFDESDFSSQAGLLEAIQRERRVELAFEGNYFHDLMRLEKPVHGLPFDDPMLRFPVPQREIDANPNLVQNLGY